MRPVLALSLPGTGPVLWGRGVLLPAQGRSGRRSCVSPGTRGHGLPTRHAAGVAEQPGGEEPALTETAWLLRGQRVPEYPWSSRWRKARMPIALQEGGFPGLEPPRSHGRPRRTGRDAWTVGRSDTGSSHGVPGCRQTPAPGWSARGMQQQSHWQLAARVGGSQGACGAAPVLAAWFKDTQPQPARFLRARSPRLPASPSSVTAPPTGGGTPSLHLHLSHQARAANHQTVQFMISVKVVQERHGLGVRVSAAGMDTPGLLAGSCHTAWDVQLHTGLHSPGCFLCSFQDLGQHGAWMPWQNRDATDSGQQSLNEPSSTPHLLLPVTLSLNVTCEALGHARLACYSPSVRRTDLYCPGSRWNQRSGEDVTITHQYLLRGGHGNAILLILSLYLDAWGMLLCLTKPHSEEWGRAGALCSSITLWFLLLSLWETSPGSAVPKSSVPCAPEETVIQKILDFVASLLWLSKALLFKP
uniref:Uncharacterized protein n=1 Tax=Rangifer tarandus platyrhynchus TaxID=3082113 RepID=A0ACB0F4R7_RANTA|nr:unnamed protein product [Rangifer tarandus platyrhynchus]